MDHLGLEVQFPLFFLVYLLVPVHQPDLEIQHQVGQVHLSLLQVLQDLPLLLVHFDLQTLFHQADLADLVVQMYQPVQVVLLIQMDLSHQVFQTNQLVL